jgi:hypothetical protein
MVTHFDILMGFMAKLAQLSSKSRNEPGAQDLEEESLEIHKNLLNWWNTCPPQLRDQDINWREKVRLVKLTLSETLQQEAFSSMKSCLQGCVIYLNHILDPLGHKPQKQVVETAIQDIINIAKKIPPGYGLEMGHYFGLFMVGITIFNDILVEETIRQLLKADQRIGVYVSLLARSCEPMLTIHSTLVELYSCLNCCGKDSISTGLNMIGAKYRTK